MAEDQSAETNQKRRVRNPETFRERALKATEASDKPQRTSLVRRAGKKFVMPIARPLVHGLRKVFNRQPFRFIGKILFPVYFRNSWRELKLVTWPNKTQSRRLTSAVLIFATIFGATIALVDFGLDKLFKQILLK
jgi:preprotein translocase SecE subunit